MRYAVAFAPVAQADLKAIFDYVRSQSGEGRARETVARLYAYCASFDQFPERGTRRDDLRPGLRVVGFRRQATVAFRIEGDQVIILRVLYGGRNVDAALSEE